MADLTAFRERDPVRYTIRAIAGYRESDQELLGVGGIYRTGYKGYVMFRMSEDARDYPVALHRGAKMLLDIAREEGHSRIYAIADPGEPSAPRWLKRLGFEYEKTASDGDHWARDL